jgi:hypothetical protein
MAQVVHADLPKQDNYDVAFRLACQELSRANIEERCRKSGALLLSQGHNKLRIELSFLGEAHVVSLPDFEICRSGGQEDVPMWNKILILHYLKTASGAPLAGKQVTFRQLPGGSIYYSTFVKRAQEPLVTYFGADPHLLEKVGTELGGSTAQYGDLAISLLAFPFVPLVFVLWRGDEEFAPGGNILFDASITDYLSTEDVAVLCQQIVFKMIRLSQSSQS